MTGFEELSLMTHHHNGYIREMAVAIFPSTYLGILFKITLLSLSSC